jgi:uncharacterized protein YycO
MAAIKKRSLVVTALALCAFALTATSASALTAELAKKCRALAIKAHPTVLPGKKTGSEAAQRAYFQDCVVKEGKVEEPAGAEAPNKDNPPRK